MLKLQEQLMPGDQNLEYNPLISGFSHSHGPMNIPLNEAKKRFGQLPSHYGFVSEKRKKDNQKRKESKTLNLHIGHCIKKLLEQKKNVKKEVYEFFSTWHRDFQTEFRVNMDPFYNLNDAVELEKTIQANQGIIYRFSQLDIKKEIENSGLIKKSTLYSIKPQEFLSQKTSEILTKRMKVTTGQKLLETKAMLDVLNAHDLMMQVSHLAGAPPISLQRDMIQCFADEISSLLIQLNAINPLNRMEALRGRSGKGIEFEYATRDESYLKLGKITGDCTADKRYDQSDTTIENIYWTVFSWILDRNYQILKVYYNNEFVMKVHLLPLFVSDPGCQVEFHSTAPGRSDFIILALDAIETTFAFSGKLKGSENHHLLAHRDEIFSETFAFIINLADSMNIKDIYAEKFSNTPWVRDKISAYPEIFLHVDHIFKIDQLEDVYCLIKELTTRYGYNVPQEVFMEIQMKNTCLLPDYINKAPGVKSFSVIRGKASDGIPMKRIIGV